MIYSVVLISAVQQSDSVIHLYTFFFIFFSIMVYARILNIVPCAQYTFNMTGTLTVNLYNNSSDKDCFLFSQLKIMLMS